MSKNKTNNEEKKERHNKQGCFSQTFKTLQKNVSLFDAQILDDMLLLFNQEKRHWFNYHDKSRDGRKNFIHQRAKIVKNGGYSYRFFQGIRQEIQGMEKSILSNRKNYLVEKQSKLKRQKTKVKNASITYKTKKRNNQLKDNDLFILRQKYKKLARLENQVEVLKSQDVKICFGGKKLLKERHTLKNETEIQAWQQRWFDKRNNQMLFVGSHEETQGNANCQLHFKNDQFSLKIRIPDCLENKYNAKYLTLHDIKIPHYAYEKIKFEVLKQQTKDVDKEALSFRLIKNEKGYALNITVNSRKQDVVTSHYQGLIGVDINADHLAVTEIDGVGNLLHSFVLPMKLDGKSTGQRQHIISQCLINLKDYALEKQKDIVIEKLNFKQKRSELEKNTNAKYAKMLSSFAYQQIISGIKVNGYKFGINIREVDPSYTSIIGKNKYSIPLGLSIHQAAAYVIARRGYEYKEKIKKIIQTNKTGQVFILAVPAWKQCLKDKRSSNGFKRWLSGKIGKSSSITEKTNGAERYVPHNKLGLSKILCDSDRNKRALN